MTKNLSRECKWSVMAATLAMVTVLAASSAWAQQPSPSPAAKPSRQPSTGQTRIEKDLLGEKEVPADAYWGVQTARALRIFSSPASPSTTTLDLSRHGPS